jgi:hypothetical protein
MFQDTQHALDDFEVEHKVSPARPERLATMYTYVPFLAKKK